MNNSHFIPGPSGVILSLMQVSYTFGGCIGIKSASVIEADENDRLDTS